MLALLFGCTPIPALLAGIVARTFENRIDSAGFLRYFDGIPRLIPASNSSTGTASIAESIVDIKENVRTMLGLVWCREGGIGDGAIVGSQMGLPEF